MHQLSTVYESGSIQAQVMEIKNYPTIDVC